MSTRECRFEPDAIPILCLDCDKPTGEMGTCDDQGLMRCMPPELCRCWDQRARGVGDDDRDRLWRVRLQTAKESASLRV